MYNYCLALEKFSISKVSHCVTLYSFRLRIAFRFLNLGFYALGSTDVDIKLWIDGEGFLLFI